MEPLHYIIFHPDNAREKLRIEGRSIVGGKSQKWTGEVWVDDENGNEDPFVLTERWLYSYCHATQLRRVPSSGGCIGSGSVLFFCSGDAANNGALQIDTLFVVDHVAQWPSSMSGLPVEFQDHFKVAHSDLWNRHFRFPFEGEHAGKFTYVANVWTEGAQEYSCLPLNKGNERVAINFTQLSQDMRRVILAKVRGKYPVLLNKTQKNELFRRVLEKAQVQVVSISTRRNLNGSGADATCRAPVIRSRSC
jgi:hypothetical protein